MQIEKEGKKRLISLQKSTLKEKSYTKENTMCVFCSSSMAHEAKKYTLAKNAMGDL